MTGCDHAPWDDVQRILCIRLDSLGDLLMTTPALRAVKQSGARRSVTLLTSRAAGRLAPLLPMVDDCISYDAPWMKATQHEHAATAPDETRSLVKRLRAKAFDAAVIFTVFSQNPLPAAMLCHMSGIPRCLAFCRENPYQLVSHWIPEPEQTAASRHEVERQLALVASVGSKTQEDRLEVRVPDAATEEVRRMLAEASINDDRPWIVVHPGASAPSRRYPIEHFAKVIDTLQQHRLPVVVTGLESEEPLARHLQSLVCRPVISLAGKTNLGQMAALLQRASLLIANNTGPVHLAAAVGTPIVDLYALTNPQHGPWRVEHRLLHTEVPCAYCYKSVCPEGHHDCLRLVDPERVVQAAWELLTAQQKRSSRGTQLAGLESALVPPSYPSVPRKEQHVHLGH